MNPAYVSIVLSLVACIWCGLVTSILVGQKRFFQELGKGVTKKDLQSLLKQLFNSLQEVSKTIEHSSKRLDVIEQDNKSHYQRLGFLRFNPFGDMGGDQSFCLCLLDDYNNGIVITSLHSRESTRLYAKEIRSSSIKKDEFSSEEWQAYTQATQSKQIIDKRISS